MDKYTIIAPKSRGHFAERIEELNVQVREWLEKELLEQRQLHYSKVFLSDAQNQYQTFIESDLYQQVLSKAFITIVEQPPLDNSKITILIKTSDEPVGYIFQSIRLTEEETRGNNSYLQTIFLFEKYIKSIEERGLNLKDHCVRTWIYVADIDVNYEGAVRARNDIFKRYGLSVDTHFIASTGIGGFSEVRGASVAMDFLTYPDIHAEDIYYLKALDHLNPTHEYGVAFERGTRLTLSGKRTFLVSGTASIDRFGHAIYIGDIVRQTGRLLENIGALLHDGGATMNDIQYFIVYLRDGSDSHVVEEFMRRVYPHIPHVCVHAKVCRPEWLVEMECIAIQRA